MIKTPLNFRCDMTIMLQPDCRAQHEGGTWHGCCKVCGEPLMLIISDRRGGYCYDCLDLIELERPVWTLDVRQ